MKKFYPERSRRATALIFTLLFTTLVAIMAFSAGKLIVSQTKLTASQEASAQAYQLARTAIDDGLYRLRKGQIVYPTDFPNNSSICSALQCAQRFYIGRNAVFPSGNTEEVNPHWSDSYPTPTSPGDQASYETWSKKIQTASETGYYDVRIYYSWILSTAFHPEAAPYLLQGVPSGSCFGTSYQCKYIVEGVGYYKDRKRILRAIVEEKQDIQGRDLYIPGNVQIIEIGGAD